jgi:hypothetical protein
MTLCKKLGSCNICVYILGLGGELLVCAKNSFVCFCYVPSPLELTIILLYVIFKWASWSFTPSRFCSHCCLMFMCLCWLLLCIVLLPFVIFYVQKTRVVKFTLVVVITIPKDLRAFVAIILFKWAMSCLDPSIMVFFAYSYVFQSDEALKF